MSQADYVRGTRKETSRFSKSLLFQHLINRGISHLRKFKEPKISSKPTIFYSYSRIPVGGLWSSQHPWFGIPDVLVHG